jgi:hypothetical protein
LRTTSQTNKFSFSFRKKCYQTANIKLTIDRLYCTTGRQNLADIFFSFISNFHITHLDVNCNKLLYTKLIKLLGVLPNLQSLGILSLSSFKLKYLSQKETECIQLWSSNNKITKLVFKSFIEEIDREKIQFFIDFCPRMEYLEVKCENNFNIELILRYILMKNIDKFLHWNLFCLWVPIANDEIVKQLQAIINREKLIWDYKTVRTTDKIYLQWKLK